MFRGGFKLLTFRETWESWWMLAYAIGLMFHVPYDWLENHTIAEK